MHVFKIERDDSPGEIRAPIKVKAGSGTRPYEIMRKTYVVAKPNGQVADWSSKLWLLKDTPEEGALPKGTKKFHLFRRLTRQTKAIEQTPEELESKFNELKKTVNDVSKMSQFEEEDRIWWEEFFGSRTTTRTRLGTDEDRSVDEKVLTRIKELFWKRTPILVEAPDALLTQPVAEDITDKVTLRDVERALTPRITPTDLSEWSRKRAVGYQTVLPGQNPADVDRRALEEVTAKRQKKLDELFTSYLVHRGESEADFVAKIQVQLHLRSPCVSKLKCFS
jgi:hypothetical protein